MSTSHRSHTRLVAFALGVFLVACGSSTSGSDAGSTSDGGADAGATCVPVTCRLDCMFGFARAANGCEICECATEPDVSCGAPSDCEVALRPGCCACLEGYSSSQIDGDPCLVRPGEATPPGCEPEPEMCALVDCVPCEPATGVDCVAGVCVGVR